MNKSEVKELKQRFTKDRCTITKMSGCYVNAEKQKVVTFDQTFLNMEDEEFYKYLDIAKRALSGKLGNNLLNLEFPMEEENVGGKQQFLLGLCKSGLTNPELTESFYDMVIESYQEAGNYLILLFHDIYDVITKTKDNLQLDESEEAYEYMLCAICPVELSKAGLGYHAEENRIGARIRDWVVKETTTGFLFPSFNDRSTDIHSLLFYTKDTVQPHMEFVEEVLGCSGKKTATMQRQSFDQIIEKGLGADTTENEMLKIDIQKNLNDMIQEHMEVYEEEEENILLDAEQLDALMQEVNVPKESAGKIKDAFSNAFCEETPVASNLIDSRALSKNLEKQEKMQLVKEVAALNEKIRETIGEEKMVAAVKSNDIIVRVKPDKAAEITKEEIGGQICLVIPLDESDEVILSTEEGSTCEVLPKEMD